MTMGNESVFEDNASQWEMWRKDKDKYHVWMTEKIGDKKATVRSHGFRFRGQYDEELKRDLDAGGVEITAGLPGEHAPPKTGLGGGRAGRGDARRFRRPRQEGNPPARAACGGPTPPPPPP